MPRDDRPRRPQEEDDYRDGPRKRNNTLLVVLLAVGALAFVGVVVVGLGLLMWTSARPAGGPAPAATVAGPAKKVYTRDELKTAVIGKSMEEVKALLGSPVRAWELQGEPVWIYENISRDPASGTDDRLVNLFFNDGKVTKIGF